jgi:hypothetical protein
LANNQQEETGELRWAVVWSEVRKVKSQKSKVKSQKSKKEIPRVLRVPPSALSALLLLNNPATRQARNTPADRPTHLAASKIDKNHFFQ